MHDQKHDDACGTSRLDAGLDRLLPCPFCGGGLTEITENGKMWIGKKYSAPITVSVRHWCAGVGGPSRAIERIGRDLEDAIAKWNMRSNAKVSGARDDLTKRDRRCRASARLPGYARTA